MGKEHATITPEWEPNYQIRINRTTACSTLEAFGWGLEYSDLLHLLFPMLAPQGTYDRSNSLERSAARNYDEPKCGEPLKEDGSRLPTADDIEKFSLAASEMAPSKNFSAFTFNTTEVETGNRFLLANYGNVRDRNSGVVPADSFLDIYPANIRIVTAARLSGTFPYFSSAARLDSHISLGSRMAGHFVDGGYYDNDGTASLIEFLASAFELGKPTKNHQTGKIRIMLIEIRDGCDLNSTDKPCVANSDHDPWGVAKQLEAPIETFWKTGQDGNSFRDRREWMILKQALGDQAEISSVIFPFTNRQRPLSWHLTTGERTQIQDDLKRTEFRLRVQKVVEWAQAGSIVMAAKLQ